MLPVFINPRGLRKERRDSGETALKALKASARDSVFVFPKLATDELPDSLVVEAFPAAFALKEAAQLFCVVQALGGGGAATAGTASEVGPSLLTFSSPTAG